MPREFSRTRRLAEQIQRELAQLIQREVKDPRLGMVTVSAVEVARDLSHAKVYVTLLGGSEHAPEALGILHKASGYLRHLLAQRVTMRTTPELHFVYDASVERGMRLTELIDDAVAADRSHDEE